MKVDLQSIIQLPDRFCAHQPAAERYRSGLFWGAITLSTLIIGFGTFQIQSIPSKIEHKAVNQLQHRPWTRSYVVVDGRDIILRGTIEPDSAIENEIRTLASIDGVRAVHNLLQETPLPTARFNVKKSEDKLIVGGQLNGDSLEMLIDMVSTTFPQKSFSDKIQIDDRIGRPLWIEGFSQSLVKLDRLSDFEVTGWRDQLEITGSAETDLSRRQIGYAVAASLLSTININNRVRQKVADGFPELSLVSDWRGSALGGVVPSEEIKQQLISSVEQAFGENEIYVDLTVNEMLLVESPLKKLVALLPGLGEVRDLRLQSDNKGFVVWGRLDTPQQLGEFLHLRNQLGLQQDVRSEITIDEGEKSAFLTMFSDQSRIILNGVLPTMKIKQKLIRDIKQNLGVYEVTDFITLEPNVSRGDWVDKWAKLLSEMPRSALGISINDDNVLLTGNVADNKQLEDIEKLLDLLFPAKKHMNWLTASN